MGTIQYDVSRYIRGELHVNTVVLQYDTRVLGTSDAPDLLEAVVAWNARYTHQFPGHAYVFITGRANDTSVHSTHHLSSLHDCAPPETISPEASIVGPGGCLLHPVWGKSAGDANGWTPFPQR